MSKRQLNEAEALFIPYYSDSIVYYNRRQNKRVTSRLPVPDTKELGWESQLVSLNDSVLLLNCGTTGFNCSQTTKTSPLV